VHVALGVQVLEDAERLNGDARDHLLAHHLPLRVPHVPQARAEHVHDHDVVVALPPLVVHLGHAVHAAERLVDAPLVRRAVVAALAAAVLKLERDLFFVFFVCVFFWRGWGVCVCERGFV
jgi:hypothetical protein